MRRSIQLVVGQLPEALPVAAQREEFSVSDPHATKYVRALHAGAQRQLVETDDLSPFALLYDRAFSARSNHFLVSKHW